MTNIPVFPDSGGAVPDFARRGLTRLLSSSASAAALVAATMVPAAFAVTPPAMGDAYVYRLVNGYNTETRGQLRYEVASVGSDRVTVSVTPDNPAAGAERTEIYTKEGNWLRYPLESHGMPVEYHFAAAYPAYVFPLDPGKSWSVRVNATVQGDRRSRSVRVDGRVLGTERVRVPAGEFDTVKIRRMVYPGDADGFRTETHIVEFDWYAPALGRVVRTERRSQWMDMSQCTRTGCGFNGDWSVFELVESRAEKR